LGASNLVAGSTIEGEVWWENMGAGVDRLVLRLVDQSGYEWTRARISPLPEFADIPPERAAVVAGHVTVQLPPSMPPGRYSWRIGVMNREGTQLVGEFALPAATDDLIITTTPLLTDPSQFDIDVWLNNQLAPEVALLGYTLPERVINAESPTYLILYWQALSAPRDYQIVLRLVNNLGKEVTRWQGKPAHNEYPMNRWSPGQIVQDVWPLRVDPQTVPGKHTLWISLRSADGEDESAANRQLSLVDRPSSVISDLQVWPHPLRFDVPDMQFEVNAHFGTELILLGYDLYFETDGSSTGVLLPTFYWQSRSNFKGAFDLYLVLQNASSGQKQAEWNVPLGVGGFKNTWQEREVLATTYRLDLGYLPNGQRYNLDVFLTLSGDPEPLPVYLHGREFASLQLENIQDKITVLVKQK
jgi:hypothetical protein